MASEETKNGNNTPISTSPLLRNGVVESENMQNEMEMNNFSRIIDNVTDDRADNVHNPELQPFPLGFQGQQFPADRISGAQTAQGRMCPQRTGFQFATAGQQFPADQISGVQTAEVRMFPQRIWFRLSDNFGQSQTSVPTQSPRRLTSPAYNLVMPVARGRGLARASNAPVRPSHKRSASKSYPVARAVHRSNTSRIPKSQTASVRPEAPTAAAFSPLARATARSFSVSDTAKDFPTDHILQDFDKPPQPSGRECFLCKRDLSFTPEAEGPISQPIVPPSVAVLPCGHYFHATCLEIITPEEKSTDPPCLICDLGGDPEGQSSNSE